MAATNPIVTIADRSIIGHRLPSSAKHPKPLDVFYHIPYARADRFKASTLLSFPDALSPTTPKGAYEATEPGPVVPSPFAEGQTAESPLTLNIYRPASSSVSSATGVGAPSSLASLSVGQLSLSSDDAHAGRGEHEKQEDKLLPVMVHIHGGGFNFGSPLDSDMASFVSWGKNDVIAVSISYRLGALGFLAGDSDRQGKEELNLGLRDQALAVEWVKRWIGVFGGDARQICVRGASAGAHSIGHHMLNPDSWNVSKLILESGSPTARSVLSPTHPRTAAQYKALQSHAGPSSSVSSLTTMPVSSLLNHAVMTWAENAEALTWPFQPVIDSVEGSDRDQSSKGMIPDLPLNLWSDFLNRHGDGNTLQAQDLSVITGFCRHEGANFVPRGKQTNKDFRDFFATLIPSFTSADLDELEALYPDPTSPSQQQQQQQVGGVTVQKTNQEQGYHNPGKQGKQWLRLQAAYAHYAYICPILHTAHCLSKAGAKVYVYEYAAVSAETDGLAGHCSQSVAVEHSLGDAVDGSARDSAAAAGAGGKGKAVLEGLADAMNTRWNEFVARPGGEMNDLWPRFNSWLSEEEGADTGDSGKGATMLVFGEGNDECAGGEEVGVPVMERVVTEFEKKACLFWWERMELSQGLGQKGGARWKY